MIFLNSHTNCPCIYVIFGLFLSLKTAWFQFKPIKMISLYGLSKLSFYWPSAIWLVTPCSTWHSSNMEPTTLIKLYHVLTQVVYFTFEEKNKLFSHTIFCNNEISHEFTLIMFVNWTPKTCQQKSAVHEIALKLLRT